MNNIIFFYFSLFAAVLIFFFIYIYFFQQPHNFCYCYHFVFWQTSMIDRLQVKVQSPNHFNFLPGYISMLIQYPYTFQDIKTKHGNVSFQQNEIRYFNSFSDFLEWFQELNISLVPQSCSYILHSHEGKHFFGQVRFHLILSAYQWRFMIKLIVKHRVNNYNNSKLSLKPDYQFWIKKCSGTLKRKSSLNTTASKLFTRRTMPAIQYRMCLQQLFLFTFFFNIT